MINNNLAMEEIKAYLIEMKNKGITKISMVDIVESLRLPVEQVEKIMEELKANGVKEID